MRIFQLSSGDLVADRRASYAAVLAQEADHAAAAELMEQALELRPGWAAGWCLLGDYRLEAGDGAGAIAAYRELARLDAEGQFGAALKLAALGAAPPPRSSSRRLARPHRRAAPKSPMSNRCSTTTRRASRPNCWSASTTRRRRSFPD
jgi:tetratricopeptide (TPR) repeat protein